MRRTTKQVRFRKESIIEASRNYFFDRGYERTTMRDIARTCGFEPPNIYNYFRSKEHLLYEVLKDAHIKALSTLKPWENDETTRPTEQLRAVIEDSFNEIVSWTKSTRMTIESELRHLTPAHQHKIFELRKEYDACLRKIIRRGIAQNEFPPINEKILGFFITSIIIRSAVWFSPEGELSGKEISDMMFHFVINGLRGSKT